MEKLLISLALVCLNLGVDAQQMNGFDLSGAAIPFNQIFRGGPPRDGIPSIDNPTFDVIENFVEFPGSTEVLGVVYNGVAKAYPVNILDWHEVVNDRFNGHPVAITYCPLCGSGIAFDSEVNGKAVAFGVSGLLYNNDVLLYDRSTFSLWSQIMAEAISGSAKGQHLQVIPTQRMTIKTWKGLHPGSLILTTETGFSRNYHKTPYTSYRTENRTFFPLTEENDTFHKKEWVIGVEVKGNYKAYPLRALAKLKGRRLTDNLGGMAIVLTWGENGENVRVKTESGEVPALQMYWFAWAAFHPETLVMIR